MKSILVVGGSGYLGQSLSRCLGDRGQTTFNSRPVAGGIHFDATQTRLRDLLPRLRSDLTHVVVTYGAINPEWCAKEPAASALINVDTVIGVMRDAMAAGLAPIFLSTDYVFDGTRGMRAEDEETCPTTQYGIQKVAVEEWLRAAKAPWIIARSSKLVSGDIGTHSVLGQWVNDIRLGRTMRCADDQIFSPAFVDDVAGAIIRLAKDGASGIFHVAGEKPFSRYALAKCFTDAVASVDPAAEINLTASKLADFPFLETRPLDTSLSTAKLQSFADIHFRAIEELCMEIAQEHFA